MQVAENKNPIPKERLNESPTIPRRYVVPKYVVGLIQEYAATYGSQGRAIQVGSELLARIQFHPIPLNETLKRGFESPDERVGMTYKLLPRTIELIDKFSERYDTRAHIFEAIVTLLSRKFIA